MCERRPGIAKFNMRPRNSSTILFIALSIFAGAMFANGMQEPSVPSARIIKSFDSDWRFTKGDPANAEKESFDDSAWRRLDIPHDWSIEGPFDAKNPTGGAGGFLPAGTGWYRKHFTLPADQTDRRVFIEFDGVMANSDVWINGFHLGKRPYGYVGFGYEMTSHINFGKDNVIAVRADNSQQPASRWYTGAGIYRHVRLISTNGVHIDKWSTFVSTPKVSKDAAVIRVASNVSNQTEEPVQTTFEWKIFDPKGNLVARTEYVAMDVAARKTGILDADLRVPNPRLWNLETPAIYKAVVTVFSKGRPLDSETVSFGIREFKFEPATGFWLNGKNFKIKGACLHHDGSAFGAAVPLAVWKYRLAELKKLGVNAIRTAHNPPAPEFLDLTDHMGFIVMDELFDQWTRAKNPFDYHKDFNEWSKIDVRDIVRRDRNHPSVIIYSAGNEIRDNHADPEKAKQTLRGLVDTFHENDPTRPVTQGLFRPNIEGARDYDNGLADILDVVGQNYREKEILAAYKQKTTRKILGTENTHELVQWLAVRDNPEYSGHFVWTGIDYLGEAAQWPTVSYNSGLLYKTVVPRPIAFQRQSWWSDKPMVYLARRVARTPRAPTDPGYSPVEERRPQVLFSDWTPKNLDRHEEDVEVYSNCEEVELFLNGKSLGKKQRPRDDSPRNWKVNFEVGTLKVVGMNGGKIVANYEVRTAGKPARINLAINKNKIADNWDDVVFVNASVVDVNGTLVPDADNLIRFKVEGAGVVAAVDSADINSHEPYQASERRAFQGLCQALIKANRRSGTVAVTATADGLSSNKIKIRVGR
jgi:beta-galactosidase